MKGKDGCAMLLEEVSDNDQDKRRDIEMKMQIIVNMKNEDGSEVAEPTAIEVEIPEMEAFTGPRVFDEIFHQYAGFHERRSAK